MNATNLLAQLTADITAPLDAWLTGRGVEAGSAVLTPPTREGAGDLALACHKFARVFRSAPQKIAAELAPIAEAHPLVASVDAVAGFLNLRFDWTAVAQRTLDWALTNDGALGYSDVLAGQKIVIEYSSPNTNKPQHLGHCRNNILGATVSTLLSAAGADVTRVNLVNDRGIHICKSMLAYQRFGEGVTPETAGKKGDHLVGDYYVKFEQAFVAEFKAAYPEAEGRPKKDVYFNTESEIGGAAREMLRKWEANDDEVRALWRTMNGWCEAGFEATYARMGVSFERIYKESEIFERGRSLVEQGLESGVFHRAENGAAVYDLTKMGLEGEKAVLRADGTTVYATQDLGSALVRTEEYDPDQMIYVVGNEQDYYFRVLFAMVGELFPKLDGKLFHLSYGMVELPDGKMKSREGTVVDADDLMDELHAAALVDCRKSFPDLDEAELDRRAEAIALGGLKFFLLKFAPETSFVFDKENSIKPKGETGVYCQYAYARASSILRKLGDLDDSVEPDYSALAHPAAQAVLTALLAFPGHTRNAALERKPSLVTKATVELARSFAGFFNHKDCNVIKAEPGAQRAMVQLVQAARRVIGGGMALLGMTALEEM